MSGAITNSDQFYIVQKGDTLYSIALKYNTTPNAIISKNNLTSTNLSIGQSLEIPLDVESTGDEEDIITDNTYIVQKGDSLYSIAKKYDISVFDLVNFNNLNNNIISVGQVLNIPTNNNNNQNGNYNLYMVQKGDNLWSISRKFGVTVNELRNINNLTSDLLSIGQTLLIP